MAAMEFENVYVIDSANLSTGVGLLVLEAATMAREGMNANDIVAKIEEFKPLVRASFVVDTLTYLHRGGRCSSVAALAGGVLKLHPKIVVENGKMDANKKPAKDGEKKEGGFNVDFKSIKGMGQMLGSFTVLRLTSMMGMANISFTKEELLKMNAQLNKIRKPKK